MTSKPLYHRFISEPWLITESGMVEFASRFSYEVPADAIKRKADAEDDDSDVADMFGKSLVSSQMLGNIGIVSFSGVMIAGAGVLENLFGSVSHSQIESAILTMAAKNPAALILDINSPGGSVSGTAELAGTVAEVSSRVPTYAFCGAGMIASGAYWVGSSASAGCFATPSSMIGSIGCLVQSLSIARLLESAGIDVATFTSAPLKATGNQAMKMTSDQAAYMQALTDEIGAEFKSAVQKNRPGVNADAFTGGVFSAKQAASLGLTDGVVSNFGAMISKVQDGADRGYHRPTGANKPAPGTPTPPGTPNSEAEWNRNASLRAEFGNSKSSYLAYLKNSHRGSVSRRQGVQSATARDFRK